MMAHGKLIEGKIISMSCRKKTGLAINPFIMSVAKITLESGCKLNSEFFRIFFFEFFEIGGNFGPAKLEYIIYFYFYKTAFNINYN